MGGFPYSGMADNLAATDTGHRAVRVWVAIGVTASLAVLMLAASHVSHGASHVSPASLPCKLSVQHPAVGVVAAVYVGEGAGIAGKTNDAMLLRRAGFDVLEVTEHTIQHALKGTRVALIWFPGGDPFGMLKHIGPSGGHAVRSFVAAGGGFVGVCAGAALGPRLGLSAFSIDGGGRGWGPVKLKMSTDTPIGTQLQGGGIDPESVGMYMWDYYNGPLFVLDDQRPPSGTSDPQVLLSYDGPVPVFNADGSTLHRASGWKNDIGKVAVGVNLYHGEGKVLVSGPHIDIDVTSKQIPSGAPPEGSVPDRFIRFVVEYVARTRKLDASCV